MSQNINDLYDVLKNLNEENKKGEGVIKVRKKPIQVTTIQFDGKNQDDVLAFTGKKDTTYSDDKGLIIHTLEGDEHVSKGDWVIKGVKGEFYPCKPDIFNKTYDK